MRHLKIAAIGGDGIGPEVIAAGCRVLGFAQDTPAADLRAAGVAEIFHDHAELPALLGIGRMAA